MLLLLVLSSNSFIYVDNFLFFSACFPSYSVQESFKKSSVNMYAEREKRKRKAKQRKEKLKRLKEFEVKNKLFAWMDGWMTVILDLMICGEQWIEEYKYNHDSLLSEQKSRRRE